jgi:hypothetical protein
MPKEGIYYLARLAKMGNLNTDMVIQALLNPKPVVMYGNAWSFTGTKAYETNGIKYIAGRWGGTMRKRVCSLVVFILLLIGNSFAFAQSPQINSGLSWLTSAQTSTGNWPEVDTTEYYSTASALDAVYALEPSSSAYTTAFQWMTGQIVSPTDYLSRRIIALKRAGMGVSSELDGLLLYRNANGGWGGETSYLSDNLDTALALQALKAANYYDASLLDQSLHYLTTNQNLDGGWGFIAGNASNTYYQTPDGGWAISPSTSGPLPGGPSNAYVTAVVLRTLNNYSSTFNVQSAIDRAAVFLLAKQTENNDGGFPQSTIKTGGPPVTGIF